MSDSHNVIYENKTYVSELPKEKKPTPRLSPKLRRKIWRSFLRRFCSGFSGGVVLYAALRIVTSLLKNPFRERCEHTKKTQFRNSSMFLFKCAKYSSWQAIIGDALSVDIVCLWSTIFKYNIPKIWQGVFSSDCARVATFFGLFPSVYHLVVQLLTAFRDNNDGWTFGVSGGVAGLSLCVLNKSMRQTLAFFTVSRALGASLSTLVTRGVVNAVPCFEVAVFCLCTSLIVYCVSLKPHYLNTGYYRSILKWSRDFTDKNLNYLHRTPGEKFISCAEGGLHEGNCFRHRLVDLIHSLPGFAKLYLPIHLTPVIVFKRKILRERPFYVLRSLLKNMVLSTSFLGIMVSLAKLTICVLRNYSHQPPPIAAYIPALGGAICGLALLLERESRRKELCLFVIPHTINILYLALKRSKLSPYLRIPHGFTILFALSMMSVMHSYECEPESLTLLINGLLKFFVGPRTNTLTNPNSRSKV